MLNSSEENSSPKTEGRQLPPAERIAQFCRKYNTRPVFRNDTWSAVTNFPATEMGRVLHNPQQFGQEAQTLVGLGTDHFNQLIGSVVAQKFKPLPSTTMEIGRLEAPSTVKAMSFLGETLNAQEAQAHRIFHEMGHVAMFYEMVPIIPNLNPNLSFTENLKGLELQVAQLRHSKTPVSKLEDLHFYSKGELLYEDLADALAIRFEGEERWNKYKQFLLSGPHPAGSTNVLRLVEKIYAKVIQP